MRLSLLVLSVITFTCSFIACEESVVGASQTSSASIRKKARTLAEKMKKDHPKGFSGFKYEDLLHHSKLLMDLFTSEDATPESICTVLNEQSVFGSLEKCVEHVSIALKMTKNFDAGKLNEIMDGLDPELKKRLENFDYKDILGGKFDYKDLIKNIDPELLGGKFNEEIDRLAKDLGDDFFKDIFSKSGDIFSKSEV